MSPYTNVSLRLSAALGSYNPTGQRTLRNFFCVEPEQDGVMLSKLSASVAECYEHAGECARGAKTAATPQLREDFLYLERSWIKLAHSIEASQRFNAFAPAEEDAE
jgi:hypothetical protein